MSWFALFDEAGVYEGAVRSLDGYDDAIRQRACPIPRAPEDFERWDREAEAFVLDAEASVNHRAGPDHIAAMHARKAVEAHLIAAGIDAPGLLLVREAALRGVDPAELAAVILDKIAAQEALELDRQAASLAGQKIGDDNG